MPPATRRSSRPRAGRRSALAQALRPRGAHRGACSRRRGSPASSGAEAAAELKRQRALAVGAGDAPRCGAHRRSTRAAADLRIPYAPLKGQALVLGGFAPDGGRPSVGPRPAGARGASSTRCRRSSLRQGFDVAGEAYEHQAPALRHSRRWHGRAAPGAAGRPPRAKSRRPSTRLSPPGCSVRRRRR